MAKQRSPTLAFDSTDYPGSPWLKPGRSGQVIDKANIVWVPGRTQADIDAAEASRQLAIHIATWGVQ